MRRRGGGGGSGIIPPKLVHDAVVHKVAAEVAREEVPQVQRVHVVVELDEEDEKLAQVVAEHVARGDGVTHRRLVYSSVPDEAELARAVLKRSTACDGAAAQVVKRGGAVHVVQQHAQVEELAVVGHDAREARNRLGLDDAPPTAAW